MHRLAPLALALSIMLVSGCVVLEEPQPDPSASASPTTTGASAPATSATKASAGGSGAMTAQEHTATGAAPCSRSAGAAYCATKTHWIDGEMTLEKLPISLASFNGNVEILGGTSGSWNLTVVLRARGDSEADARANLDNIQFTWSHQSGGEHAVKAEAKRKLALGNNQESATMTLTVPASVLVTVVGTTSNGAATARGLQAEDVSLTTTNGAVSVQDAKAGDVVLRTSNGMITVSTVTADTIDAETTNGMVTATAAARDYRLATTNGKMDLKLRPTASGAVTVTSTNAQVNLQLPEDAQHGHDLKASTTNGMVTVSLKDGQSAGTMNSKTFKTNNYGGREIQTKSSVTGTNAMVTVSPL